MTALSTYLIMTTLDILERENYLKITIFQSTSGVWVLRSESAWLIDYSQRRSLPILRWRQKASLQMDGHWSCQVLFTTNSLKAWWFCQQIWDRNPHRSSRHLCVERSCLGPQALVLLSTGNSCRASSRWGEGSSELVPEHLPQDKGPWLACQI